MRIDRVVLIVLDSVGIGSLPDADRFNDRGANTLSHIYRERGRLDLPNLCALGLGKISDIGCKPKPIIGCYGKMAEQSPDKDTTTGHWEIAGIVLDTSFPTYPKGFPQEIIHEFERKIGTRTLGNYTASGTEIIKELGETHINTGYPIVYTSADSVFQIAAHVDALPLDKLYEYCTIARNILTGGHAVGRVIARPFAGTAGNFQRDNGARKDYSLAPPEQTLLDLLKKNGLSVVGVGKIGDIFGHRGLTAEIHTHSNRDGIDKTIEALNAYKDKKGLLFVNLVDFDMVYGHRQNVEGYAQALEYFDRRLPEIKKILKDEDVLVITADHGCDPTHRLHTDHTREYVPLLLYGKNVKKNIDLGIRETFADCGQTVADLLNAGSLKNGKSFKGEIIDEQEGQGSG
ncbi:MAG TPA: phosphopentomutase [Deltaproteobacteria bacterium]|nr:phosphopentomutase [Deltaproteobacteria bacterium]